MRCSAARAAPTLIALCGLLGGCGDECSSFSEFTCKRSRLPITM